MARQDELAAGASVRCLAPEGLATVAGLQWPSGEVGETIYSRSGRQWGDDLIGLQHSHTARCEDRLVMEEAKNVLEKWGSTARLCRNMLVPRRGRAGGTMSRK
jgi:hypothetical protein